MTIDSHDPTQGNGNEGGDESPSDFFEICGQLATSVLNGRLPLVAVLQLSIQPATPPILRRAAATVSLSICGMFLRPVNETGTIH